VHEAGHLVIAQWAGVWADARIWKPENPDPGDRTWTGQVRMRHGELLSLTRHRRAMIGVAGEVANELRDDPGCSYDVVDGLVMSCFPMSPSDWRMAGAEPEIFEWVDDNEREMERRENEQARLIKAAKAVVKLLTGRLRPDFDRAAALLELEGRA
jgi:hypothetical protein